MHLSDTAMFTALGLMLLSAVGAPVFAYKAVRGEHWRNAVLLGLCTTLGLVCSTPFPAMGRLPWLLLPQMAFVYFGTTLIAVVVHGTTAAHSHPEQNEPPTSGAGDDPSEGEGE